MSELPRSRIATLARAQLAMALTAADAMRRYAELTATYGEEVVRAAATIAQEVVKPEGRGWDRAAAHALAGYRDYVRELAALPGIANMHYYDQLGRRAPQGATSSSATSSSVQPPRGPDGAGAAVPQPPRQSAGAGAQTPE
jgi:hypothetical protein